MGGPIHCIASDETGTKVALSCGSDVVIVEQYAICELNFTLAHCDGRVEPQQLYGRTQETSLDHRRYQGWMRNSQIQLGALFISSKTGSRWWSRTLIMGLCKSFCSLSQALAPMNIVSSCWDISSLELKWQITPRTCSMCVLTGVNEFLNIRSSIHRASSTISPDEKVVVVANLYDGLDWYKIPDRSFSRSVPLRINQNFPIPVLLVDGGNTLLVGSTSGNVKILDAHTAETIQTLEHDRMSSTIRSPPIILTKALIM